MCEYPFLESFEMLVLLSLGSLMYRCCLLTRSAPNHRVDSRFSTIPSSMYLFICQRSGYSMIRRTKLTGTYNGAALRRLLEPTLVYVHVRCCCDMMWLWSGRLSTLVRGVGDPMVAVYCRCFIAAAGSKIAPLETAHAASSLQDYLFSLQVRGGLFN